MTRTKTLWALGTIALAMGCGGIVSLGDPGDGKDRLGGLPADDTGGGGGVDAGADWPGMMTGLDGSVPDPGIGDFTELIWQRWWYCGSASGGPICKQEFWINAQCQTFWNDRDGGGKLGTLDAENCTALMNTIQTMKLADSLQDPTACPAGPNGGKIYELHLGGHVGPKYRKRVDSCAFAGGAAGGGEIEKFIAAAVRTIPGATEHDLHVQMSDP